MKRVKLTKTYVLPDPQGFTLLEIILAVLILGIAIAPMMSAFAPALLSTGSEEETAVFTNQARGTLNRVISLDFDILHAHQGTPADLVALFSSTAEADKETFSLNSFSYSPIVSIADVSAGSGGLLEITTTVDRISLKTLKAEY